MKVYLIGVGLGDEGSLTLAARDAIAKCDLIIGAQRLIDSFPDAPGEKRALIKVADIVGAVMAGDAQTVSLLFSGDSGFFSGATNVCKALDAQAAEGADLDIEVLPGISSLQAFCAKLHTNWDDAFVTSAHGRDCNVVAAVHRHPKVLMLTGGATKAHDICAQLADAGLGDVRVTVGERLSYPDERFLHGSAAELAEEEFANLAVMFIEAAEQEPASVPGGAFPRVLIAAPKSGSGKTSFTCGLLRALTRRGLRPVSFKVGPDYIDPMFHRQALGIDARNVDLFFMGADSVRQALAEEASDHDIAVIEGAMGYYDGIANGTDASAWQVACEAGAPTLLVVDAHGQARSVAAEVLGFASLRYAHHIAGVVLNRVSESYYPQLKEAIEQECSIPVVGFVPKLSDDAVFESRHLGLVTADEYDDIQQRIDRLADVLERTVDIDAVLAIAQEQADGRVPADGVRADACAGGTDARPVVALARDEAFCFYYADTVRLFERLGAEVVEFSPLHDAALPAGATHLYLGGGYPELYARELSDNAAMRDAVRSAIDAGMPTIAECGGFLYLHAELESADGTFFPMVGAVPVRAFKTDRLGRFGYITLTAQEDGLLGPAGMQLRGHEFHYWESEEPGSSFAAQKPQSKRHWECSIHTPTLYAGFPHIYLPSNLEAARRFLG